MAVDFLVRFQRKLFVHINEFGVLNVVWSFCFLRFTSMNIMISNLLSANALEDHSNVAMQPHFLFIHNLSRTDVECQWRKRKASTSLSIQAVTEMFPPPKKYTALARKPTEVDRSELYEDLKKYGRFTGLCRLIRPEPPAISKLPIPTTEEIMYSEEFLQTRGVQQQLDCLVRRSKILDEDIMRTSEITVGQRDNPAWHFARKGRLTASNFGSVLKAKRVTPSLLKRLLGEYDLSRVKAV